MVVVGAEPDRPGETRRVGVADVVESGVVGRALGERREGAIAADREAFLVGRNDAPVVEGLGMQPGDVLADFDRGDAGAGVGLRGAGRPPAVDEGGAVVEVVAGAPAVGIDGRVEGRAFGGFVGSRFVDDHRAPVGGGEAAVFAV